MNFSKVIKTHREQESMRVDLIYSRKKHPCELCAIHALKTAVVRGQTGLG